MLSGADKAGLLTYEDALNRFPLRCTDKDSKGTENGKDDGKHPRSIDSTLWVMMYIFPRQFTLHNAFTSHVDTTQTAQKFQDYTLREEEIHRKFRNVEGCTGLLDIHVPKRLRGKPQYLVQRLQVLHARCSYASLLQHHCPVCICYLNQLPWRSLFSWLTGIRFDGLDPTVMLVNDIAALRPPYRTTSSLVTPPGAVRRLGKHIRLQDFRNIPR